MDFMRKIFAIAQDRGEGVLGEKFFDDFHREGVWFIGKDRNRDTVRAKILQQFRDAGIDGGAGGPGDCVIGGEIFQHAFGKIRA